jgi:hypothetical protein
MNRGSEWRKWEPHIHAPGTVMNNQFGGPNAWHDFAMVEAGGFAPPSEDVKPTAYYIA